MSITPRKILLVNADRKERAKLAIMLARFGHSVAFSDGKELPEFSDDKYDLIIIDDGLPQGAGFNYLLDLSLENRSKAIFLSGESENTAKGRGQVNDIGMYECLAKPVNPINLAVVVCDFFLSSFKEGSFEKYNSVS